MASKAIRIKRGYRSIDLAQHEAAQRLRTKGYAVDTISTSVYVNGWRLEDGSLKMLTEAEAVEAIAMFEDQRADKDASSSDSVYIDAAFDVDS